MWDIYQDKFIGSDDEYCAVLMCIGLVHYDYATPKAKKLYNDLSKEDKQYIVNRIEQLKEKTNG